MFLKKSAILGNFDMENNLFIFKGTSGAPFMDYIITDAQTSPITLQSQYSEKLAYMPNTFFIGDHKQMFPHIKERIILKDHKVDQNGGHVKDNVAVINTIDKRSILEKADIKQISQVSMVDDGNKEMEVEVKVTIAQLPTTQPIDRYLIFSIWTKKS